MSEKAKVTVNPTPSAQVIAGAQAVTVITDAKGRKLSLKDPGVLAQYRLVRIIGGEAAKNETYVNMLIPLLWVCQIGDDAVANPSTEREIDALITRLGSEGILAITDHLQKAAGSEGNIEAPVKN